jgi:hypothetical protein
MKKGENKLRKWKVKTFSLFESQIPSIFKGIKNFHYLKVKNLQY